MARRDALSPSSSQAAPPLLRLCFSSTLEFSGSLRPCPALWCTLQGGSPWRPGTASSLLLAALGLGAATVLEAELAALARLPAGGGAGRGLPCCRAVELTRTGRRRRKCRCVGAGLSVMGVAEAAWAAAPSLPHTVHNSLLPRLLPSYSALLTVCVQAAVLRRPCFPPPLPPPGALLAVAVLDSLATRLAAVSGWLHHGVWLLVPAGRQRGACCSAFGQ